MDDELRGVPPVLMYHSVQVYRTDPNQITVDPRRFEQQLRWLRQRGLRGVTVTEVLRATRAGDAAGLVGLTFDDGYLDFVTEVLPRLDRYGFTASVYVVAGELDGHNAWDSPAPRKPLMSATDVRRVAAAGMEIGSHSRSHVRLPQLTDAELGTQVRESRQRLAELIGADVTGFCYPYGAVGPREAAAVRDAGYAYACAVRSPKPTSPYAVPRIFVGDRDGPTRLYAKLARHRLRRPRLTHAASGAPR